MWVFGSCIYTAFTFSKYNVNTLFKSAFKMHIFIAFKCNVNILKLCAFRSTFKIYIIIILKYTFTKYNMNATSKCYRSFLVKTYIRCDGDIGARPFSLAAEFGPVRVRPIWSQVR